jgi:branched-chain amino acid transport system ATP-binding protein
MENNQSLLKVVDLVAGYGPKDVLHGVSLEVKHKQIVALLGLNGVGKTTLLKTIIGLIPTKNGTIHFNGKDITGAKINDRVKKGISLMPQDDPVFPDMTVGENLDMGAWLLRDYDQKTKRLREIYELFPRLFERRKQKAGSLSGGERQMLSIARALIIQPQLLMMDEPSLGLMPRLVDAIFEKVHEIRRQGVAILLVEQNVAKALNCVDSGYVLDMGEIKFSGNTEALSRFTF